MILDATTKKLQVVLAAAITTSQLPVVSNWVDMTATATTPGNTTTATNSTTQVDIVAAPAASTQRVIQSLSVYNKDTANATVTIQLDDNGTDREIVKVLLNPGQSLVFTPGSGWQVVTSHQQGGNYASFRAHKNTTDQTGILPSTDTKLTFTTEVFDIGGYYDAPNSKWTPPAGPVEVGAAVFFSAGQIAGAVGNVKIFKNGAEFASLFVVAYANAAPLQPPVVVKDNANGTDYYEVYFFGDGAGNKTISGLTAYSYFQGSCL